MNPVKEIAINDLFERLNKSPFLLVVDYTKTTVPQFNEARKRLREVGAKMTVAKNSFVRLAAKRAGLSEDIVKSLLGQSAIVTGAEDVAAAAKVLKTYQKESKRLAFRGGLVDGNFVDEAAANVLADLPSKQQLQAQLLGVLLAPASKLVRTLNEPAASLARVLQAHADSTKAA
jgi:large subunit ribosomal protein L10